MPRRKKDTEEESEESVWEEESFDADEDDEALDVEESEEEEIVVKKKKEKAPKAKRSVPKVKDNASKSTDNVNDLSSSENEEEMEIPTADVPSVLRKTANGGYRATDEQRRKIGMANKGNVPWNKGKNRSESAKSRIRAGVQAANRKKLKIKLKAFGLTEQEYELKMKQIKRARERLRLAKKAMAEQRQRVKHATIRTTAAAAARAKKEAEGKAAKEAAEKKVAERRAAEAARLAALTQVARIQTKQNSAIINARQSRVRSRPQAIVSAEGVPGFPKQLVLETVTFHPYRVFPKENALPEQTNERFLVTGPCPTNSGPGGLICCQECSRRYHDVLTTTAKDIEDSRLNNVANSMKQMMEWISITTNGLGDAMETAQGLPPPPKPRKLAKAKVMLD